MMDSDTETVLYCESEAEAITALGRKGSAIWHDLHRNDPPPTNLGTVKIQISLASDKVKHFELLVPIGPQGIDKALKEALELARHQLKKDGLL